MAHSVALEGVVRLAERVSHLAPTRYVILFAIRSGSSLLCNDLAKAGLGTPTEHFQGPSIPVGRAGAYVEDVVRASGSIFGTKIAWEQAFALLRRLADEGEHIPTFDLRHVFGGDVQAIRLSRRNKVRQAISAWRAATSGVWHVPTGSGLSSPEVPYDPEAITEILQQLLLEDYLWERYLRAVDWNALTVFYEDFIEDRSEWIGRIGEHIGCPLEQNVTVEDSLRPMADAWTDEIENRLDRELAAPSHPFWTSPSLQWTVPASLPKDRCIPLP